MTKPIFALTAALLIAGCSAKVGASSCDQDLYQIAALHALGESPCDTFSCDLIALHKFTAAARARASRQHNACMKAAMNDWADYWDRDADRVASDNTRWERGVALSNKAQP